ncbi:PmoA family protein [Amycolatopsis australiensis]|uniref:Methane oxygenase PmoA n=1 Tax=Amycolatopsis australiensis TaxID=546364 RepID=A0A1K1T5C4_9PSEU|nr:PmoA family protein [Amycolatopsis australiensis]SFW91718.1 Methane oxygenase PmoA [Amycolatopsis australiensis]
MSGPITVTHRHGDRVTVEADGIALMSYVYKPDPVAYESRKPYTHPLRTLRGRRVSGYRPADHRWHKGLQMTASHLSGQNFWGGHTYVPGHWYQDLPDRIGSMRHDGFAAFAVEADRLALTERLTWVANRGDEWARERRDIVVHAVEPDEGAWAIDWGIELTNIRGTPLVFGSPTTAGRAQAGYTGLHWRGPRDFSGGRVFGPGDLGGDTMMGAQAPWLAFVGEHDDVDAHSTLVFVHAPENDHAIHESHWFVRSRETPMVAFSWAFFDEFVLPPGESFTYRYRIVVADGAWDREQVTRYLGRHGWS